MPRRLLPGAVIAVLVVLHAAGAMAQTPPPAAVFPLTVDAIMRGPALVGYPPCDLRWSGDSRELYFEWRMPGEDEAATWVVGRDGGTPRRLSDAERRMAPLANGCWDGNRAPHPRRRSRRHRRHRHRRAKTDRPDADHGRRSGPALGSRRQHVTFVRDNKLFIVPVDALGGGRLVQLIDAATARRPPKPTDSQRRPRNEEKQLIDWVEQEAARRAPPGSARPRPGAAALRARRAADGLSMRCSPPTRPTCGSSVSDRAQARTAQVPRFVSESAYTEEINARTFVGDAQDGRRLVVLDLKTGDGVWAGPRRHRSEPRVIEASAAADRRR